KNSTKIDRNKNKILILGANGFLGSNIIQLRSENKVIFKDFSFIAANLHNNYIDKAVPFYHIDITHQEDVYNKIVNLSPDIIVLTAALTNVDQNEKDKRLATKINVEGPKNVVKACEQIDSKLIFMSTDFVFDGEKKGYYTEDDIPNPISHYAKTKLDAELAIKNSDIDHLICRTAVLYGWNNEKLNFVTWVLKKLHDKERINIVTDQINNPTYVRNLAEIILKLIEKKASGIYHTAGDDALSRYEIAIKCAEVFEHDKNLINPIESLKQVAIRPKNASLNVTKLKEFLGSELKCLSLLEGLNDMKNRR
ncbi:unnamed protein product, partial [marine sediment metagenome]